MIVNQEQLGTSSKMNASRVFHIHTYSCSTLQDNSLLAACQVGVKTKGIDIRVSAIATVCLYVLERL